MVKPFQERRKKATNEMKVFESAEFGEVRVVTINDEPWFVGKDVAEILGYERPTKAIKDHTDTEDVHEVPIQDAIGRMFIHDKLASIGIYPVGKEGEGEW